MQIIKINKKIFYSLLITLFFSPILTMAAVSATNNSVGSSDTPSPSQGVGAVDLDNLFNSPIDINKIDPTDDGIQEEIKRDIQADTDNFIESLDNGFLDITFISNCDTLTCHLKNIMAAVEGLILIVIGLSVLVFLWGMIKYVKSVDDETRKQAIGTITYGVIALFVMISVWGLVNLLTTTFGFDSSMNKLKNTNINPTNLIKK